MTARTAAAIASVTLALASSACLSFYEIAVETPIQAKIDVTPFRRVLVAGFLSGGSNNIDPNSETARLLRSQLRTKSDMTVIDADVISLVDEVDRRRGTQAPAPVPVGQPAEPKVRTEEDLKSYESIFSDTEFWKRLGEEYQGPLIVTGTVMFTEIERSGMVARPQSYTDAQGRPQFSEVRQYANQAGFALTPKFVFIDGRTGAQLYSEAFHEESLYPTTQSTPALSSYFELMDKLLPAFLNTLSTQRIRGTRILLK
jgi:hypothetical protein